jgi:hypothetical protein
MIVSVFLPDAARFQVCRADLISAFTVVSVLCWLNIKDEYKSDVAKNKTGMIARKDFIQLFLVKEEVAGMVNNVRE